MHTSSRTETAQRAGVAPVGRFRVVVVDDSSDVRFLLTTIMELDGRFEIVGEAPDADAGYTMVVALDPDLVLIDLNLGGVGGIELLRGLVARGTRAALAVVTASSAALDHADAFDAGADSVHSKMSLTSTMADELAAIVEAKIV